MIPTLIPLPRFHDERGWFSEQWQESWKKEYKIPRCMVQTNMAYTHKRNTIRGLHAQVGLAKLVTVVKGSIMDVVVDQDGNHRKFILTDETPQALYVPSGFYHGYKTLTDDVIVMYHQNDYYNPKLEYGVCWNDSELNIDWELDGEPIVSDKDKNHPNWSI